MADWLWLLTRNLVLLGVGGAVGTWARYGISASLGGLPIGTFLINVSGSFILGAAIGIIDRWPPEYSYWRLLVGTGFCGGFTTFSTFEYDTYRLVRDGSWLLAMVYAFGSLLAGFAGVYASVVLLDWVWPKV